MMRLSSMGRKPKNNLPETSEETTKISPVELAATEAAPAPQQRAFVQRNQDESKPAPKKRLQFSVTEQGTIDWESMHGKTKEEIKAVFKSDPEAMRIAGRTVDSEDLFKFTPENAKMALRILAQANQFATKIIIKRFQQLDLDADILKAAFQFQSEDEKQLGEMGANLANRYSTEWMREHAELIMFFSLYMKATTQQVMGAVLAQLQRNEERARAAKPNGHAGQPQQKSTIDLATEVPRN